MVPRHPLKGVILRPAATTCAVAVEVSGQLADCAPPASCDTVRDNFGSSGHMAQPASRDRLSSTTLSLSLVALSCAFSSELHNETAAVATTASLERDGGGGGWQDANPELLVYMKAAKVLDSLQPAQPALCTGLTKLAEMADTGSYAVRNWGLAALREAQQQDCVPLEGRVLTGETSDVNSAPWGSGGPKLRLGAFGPGDEETAEALEQIDREEEWNEARQKHALRDIKRVDEAFAFEVDVADIHPEDDALARWALGKRYEDAMPDSRLRVAMQRILGAAEADAVGGSRSHAHDVEYGPPMDRSELIAKHANLARVVLLARDDVWESLPLSEGLLLPSSAPSADAARTLVRVALQHFKKLKLDVLTEEGQLWWARWAACFERNGDELTDAGDTPRRFDEMRELAIGKIWLERMLDALGSRLRGEECCNWLKAAKPLLQAAWGTDETARWLTRVEERSEHEATDDGYREKKHERALLVERCAACGVPLPCTRCAACVVPLRCTRACTLAQLSFLPSLDPHVWQVPHDDAAAARQPALPRGGTRQVGAPRLPDRHRGRRHRQPRRPHVWRDAAGPRRALAQGARQAARRPAALHAVRARRQRGGQPVRRAAVGDRRVPHALPAVGRARLWSSEGVDPGERARDGGRLPGQADRLVGRLRGAAALQPRGGPGHRALRRLPAHREPPRVRAQLRPRGLLPPVLYERPRRPGARLRAAPSQRWRGAVLAASVPCTVPTMAQLLMYPGCSMYNYVDRDLEQKIYQLTAPQLHDACEHRIPARE